MHVVIDMQKTGERIRTLRESRSLSVKQLQALLGLETVQSIYRWQWGLSLPTLENCIMLTRILGLETIEDILVFRESGD